MFQNGWIPYDSMLLSDWLINYEGGFVRRGLMGELLLGLYNIIPHSIVYTIIGIYVISLMTLLYIICYVFRQNGWSLFIAVFPICIFVSFLGVRRDYLMLVICYFLFMQFSKFLQTNDKSHIVWANVISIIAILLHEVFFFFTIPILMLFTLANQPKISNRTYINTVLLWLPALLSMLAVCLFKGDNNVAQSIWNSWMPCFENYPMTGHMPPMGSAVEWLTYDTSYALPFHIHKFWLSKFIYSLPSWPFNIYVIACTFILVTRLNTINVQFWPLHSVDSSKLGSVLLLQLLFLFPMFGLLSFDFGRIIMYWTLSSLFAYHWLHEYFTIPQSIQRISTKLQTAIDKTRIAKYRWLYLTVLITLPVARFEGANILSSFAFVPYGWRLTFWSHILHTLPIALE